MPVGEGGRRPWKRGVYRDVFTRQHVITRGTVGWGLITKLRTCHFKHSSVQQILIQPATETA